MVEKFLTHLAPASGVSVLAWSLFHQTATTTPVSDNPFVTFLIPLLSQFGSLGGIAALVAVMVNIFKTAGVVKDGQAPKWSLGLNAVGFVVFFGVVTFVPSFDVKYADGQADQLATLLVGGLQLVYQLWLTRKAHEGVKGYPVIGKSFTLEQMPSVIAAIQASHPQN